MTSLPSSQDEKVEKGFGLPETVDPNHEYVYRSGEYGVYQYWYKDKFENYWLYTNAPVDHEDYDEDGGEAIIDPNQPLPHSNTEFFTSDGEKRNQAVPQDVNLQENPRYNANDMRLIWKEMYQGPNGTPRYIYLDKDIRENPDMWVQHQLRVVDSMIPKYRQFANNLFQSSHPKDKIFGALLMLVDQGCFTVEELISAQVEDLDFIDHTVVLLGRKFICDLAFYDFLTTLKTTRPSEDELFQLSTVYGKKPLGLHHVFSFFAALRISPAFLLHWHASLMFSRVIHRLVAEEPDPESLKQRAFREVAFALNLDEGEDVESLIDIRVMNTVLSNYGQSFGKSINRAIGDEFGVFMVLSDLTSRKPDEMQFSMWLHAEPMHEMSPEEELALEQELAQAHAAAEAEQQAGPEAGGPEPTDSGSSPAPGEGEAPQTRGEA